MSHVLTQARYLTSVVKRTIGPSLQSSQTKHMNILKVLEQCLTKSTTYDCAKIRKPKLDSEPSCEIKYLIFFVLQMGKLRHRERSKWQSQGANLNSLEPGPAVITPTPYLPAQTRGSFPQDRLSQQLLRGLVSALTSYEMSFKIICDSKSVYAD